MSMVSIRRALALAALVLAAFSFATIGPTMLLAIAIMLLCAALVL